MSIDTLTPREPATLVEGGGLDPAPLAARLDRILSPDLEKPFDDPYLMSGGVFAVSGPDGAPTIVAKGVDAHGVPLTTDSLMHLASASKLAMGLLILRLVEEGALDLEAPLAAVLPEARASRTPGLTLRRLLSHTSGLPLEIGHELSTPPGPVRYEAGLKWPGAMADACLATEVINAPGAIVQYSNLGYGLVGLMAERVTGESLGALLERWVFRPLGIEAYFGAPARSPIMVGGVSGPYAGTDIEPFNSATFLGMGAPWANVSTTASGLLALVRAYGDDGPLLRPETAREARTDQTGGASGGFTTTESFLTQPDARVLTWSPCPWGLAIEIKGAKQVHWGPSGHPNSVGKLGSSGCVGWYDPETGVAWAVFGTRTNFSGWLTRFGPHFGKTAFATAAQS